MLSGVKSYPRINQTAIKEMQRQVGDLSLDEAGIARRGLIIRHLVLPNALAGSETILRFIAEEISIDSYVSIMDQFRPTYKAGAVSDLSRRITQSEFAGVVQYARRIGLNRAGLR